MSDLVTNGATLKCPLGDATATLIVIPPTVMAESNPVATIADCIPFANIPPFGTCKTLTAAASGVPTPCVPATVPWVPGSPTVMVRGIPALNKSSTCICSIGGVISITDAGTTKESVA
jgi:Domain of unknown function (DUF4280)